MAPSSDLNVVIVVSGMPGSGKTTLARALSRELGVPLVSKDIIKEALFDALDTGDLAWSQQLGRASHTVMYALARDMRTVILESHFWHGVAEQDLLALRRPLVQVHCRCPVEVAVARYRERINSADRHRGHLPEHQSEEAIAHWRTNPDDPLALDAPLVEVDTTQPIDIERVAEQVRAHLS